jgi:Mg/Co/Ni transporter MgtE
MLYLSQIQNQRIWDAFGRPVGRCTDILEEMDPDEATDLLADLPKMTSTQLLGLMQRENAA